LQQAVSLAAVSVGGRDSPNVLIQDVIVVVEIPAPIVASAVTAAFK